MKNKRRLLSVFLAFGVAMSPLSEPFSYGADLWDMLSTKSISIGESTTLANGVYWNTGGNDKVVENYIQYKPGGTVIPKISYGADAYGAPSFKTVLARAEAEGDHVIAGINGDYFNTANGVAFGITIKDGILRTSESSANPAIGFFPDGTAMIGRANLNIQLTGAALGTGISFIHLNKVVTTTSGVMLYTADFGDDDTNKATIPTYNVIISPIAGELTINGTIEATVDSVGEATAATKIPEGKMMLSIASASAYPGTVSKLATLVPGDQVALSFAADPAWNTVEYAVGGGVKLITAGVNVAPTTGEVDPRTAIGIKADGSLVFYTVDGRKPGSSMGASLYQVAERLLALGCVEAMNMDGGGSTAVHSIYPGDSTTSLINTPSEGSLRNCANYILLVNQSEPSGSLSRLFVYPYSARLLAGATQTFTVKATDQNYYAVSPPTSLSYKATSGLGTIDNTGVFTAGTKAMTGTLSATSGSKASNEASVTVVEKPDSITVSNQADQKSLTTLTVNAKDQIDLTAVAFSNKLPLISQDSCFDWSVPEELGTIDDNGRFTVANLTNGTGLITVSAGGTTATVSVKVVSEGQRLESFEALTSTLQGNGIPGLTVSLNPDLSKVRYGYQSAELAYDFDIAESQIITLPTSLPFTKSPDTFSLWVYGDGSSNTMNLVFQTGTGNQEVIGTTLSFLGWKQVVVQAPTGSTGLSGIRILKTGNPKGILYLDQMLSAIGYYVDQEPPTVDLQLSGTAITAAVRDEVDNSLVSADLSLTLDGQPLSFTYNTSTFILTASLPAADGIPHKLTLLAMDESGNLGRATLAIPGGEMTADPFLDMGSHWAKESTGYLYSRGIINGVKTEQGLLYNPDKKITRAEFAVLMSNWLGEDPTLYEEVELPFADTQSIPAWALSAAKTMYGMGMIRGIGVDGALYFNPQSPISREEVMTIIGRTQVRGYGENDLTSYKDGSKVSSWALPYVKTLVQQSVVSGYDGNLWPKNLVTRAQVAVMITSLN